MVYILVNCVITFIVCADSIGYFKVIGSHMDLTAKEAIPSKGHFFCDTTWKILRTELFSEWQIYLMLHINLHSIYWNYFIYKFDNFITIFSTKISWEKGHIVWKTFYFSCNQAALWMVPSLRPLVCPSVCLSVTPFSLCYHHHIIMKFSGVIINERIDVHASDQGQRSKVKVTSQNPI